MKKHVFYLGDRVRILAGRRVVRVGYPKALEDYAAEVRERFELRVAGMCPARALRLHTTTTQRVHRSPT